MVFDYSLPRYHEGVSAAALGIKELVAEATTYFWGSWQNRRTNIAVGAGKLNGIIIAPGKSLHLIITWAISRRKRASSMAR